MHLRRRVSEHLLGLIYKDSVPCRHVNDLSRDLVVLFQPRARFSVDSRDDTNKLEDAVRTHLDGLQKRHDTLVASLGNPGVSQQDMTVMSKELAGFSNLVQAKASMDRISKEMLDLKHMLDGTVDDCDGDLKELAEEEIVALQAEYATLLDTVVDSMIPKDAMDEKGCVVEVRAGTGGEEACLFAKNLFSMYERYCAFKGWEWDSVEQSVSEMGGFKVAIATVSAPKYSQSSGVMPYGILKYESGVHRVQRVPATESGGRIHTSAASVTILPEADVFDLDLKDEDIRIDTYRSSGAGGQHVNTTDSAVRVTHIPTGTSVAIQDERSQHKNKAKALSVLRARILDAELQKIAASQSHSRKQQIGSGDRSARVRTFNIPQGRVTDHRVSFSVHGDLQQSSLLSGESLDEIIRQLQLADKNMAIETQILGASKDSPEIDPARTGVK